MKEFLFVFDKDSVFSEIKIRAITQSEAERLLKILVKVAESQITQIKCLTD